MKYSEAVDFLDKRIVLGVKPSLDRIRCVCRLMGEPQTAYDAVQITGTNGKTSVARMVAKILSQCGFRVGLYTSPHLETVRERILVDGRLIPAGRFADCLTDIAPFIESAEAEVGEALTYFEVVTAVAFRYFQRSGIDVAVLEVGMGGRWDATNVVFSEVAVITNIGLDHTEELGRTKQQIASEKVGIINEGATVVTSEGSRELLMLISSRCGEAGAALKVFGRDFKLDYLLPYRVPGEPRAQLIAVRTSDGQEFTDIKLPLLGKHQAVNAACSIETARAYAAPRDRVDVERFKSALQSIEMPGRMEVLREHPLVVVDGAHNPPGVERLVSALREEFDYSRLVFVVSILADKDARAMLRMLGSLSDDIVVTENRSARAMPAEHLGRLCGTEGIKHRVEPDFTSAMELAYNIAGWDGLVCVTGSLYSVSEARIAYRRQSGIRELRQDR